MLQNTSVQSERRSPCRRVVGETSRRSAGCKFMPKFCALTYRQHNKLDMAQDVTDLEPPAKAPIRFEDDFLREQFASAGTTEKWLHCPRCLTKQDHKHRQNSAAQCRRACVLCDKKSHRGKPCPEMASYPKVFTPVYLRAHYPEALDPQAEQAPKNAGTSSTSASKFDRRNEMSPQYRDDRNHRDEKSSRPGKHPHKGKSYQHRDDRHHRGDHGPSDKYTSRDDRERLDSRRRTRSPSRRRSPSWYYRDRKRLRSPYSRRDLAHDDRRSHSRSRSRHQDYRERLSDPYARGRSRRRGSRDRSESTRPRSPRRQKSRDHTRAKEDRPDSQSVTPATIVLRARMAAKAALREQTSEDAGDDAMDMQDPAPIADPSSHQQKFINELQEMLEEKDKQLREKDRLIQVLLDQIHMLQQLGGDAQQNNPASTNGGPSYSNDELGGGIKRED
jgi:hypothetical protein